MKKKKLLLLTEYWPPDEGGMAVYAYEVFSRLGKLGWEVKVLCPKSSYPRINTELENLNFHFFHSPKIHALGRVTIFPLLLRELLTKQYQVLIDLSVAPYAGASALVNKLFQLPHVVIAHGNEVSRIYPEQQMSIIFRKYCLFGFKHSTVIAANSHFTASLFEPLSITKNKIKVIYCGVNTDLFQMVNRENIYQNEKKKLLIVGQLKPMKGHQYLLQALPKILAHYPNVILDVIGTGPSEEELKSLVNTLQLEKYIHFHGQIAQKELVTFYQNAYLLILPTLTVPLHFEGFGLVAAEAMACGCPVAASKVGGHTEFVIDGQTGRLFDVTDIDDIASKVIECLEHPELMKKYSQNGYELIHQHFNWDKSAFLWNQLLEDLIRSKNHN